MICPSCHSALADDLSYCLHCGSYLGELTRVATPRIQPPTTIAAFNVGILPATQTVRPTGLSTKAALVIIILGIMVILILLNIIVWTGLRTYLNI